MVEMVIQPSNGAVERHISCGRKKKYKTEFSAVKGMKEILRNGNRPKYLGYYHCKVCNNFHITYNRIKGV